MALEREATKQDTSGAPRDKISQAIETFNRYRSPEAHADMLAFDGRRITVRFSGHFCKSCGFHDYFDDLLFMLGDAGVDTAIGNVQEIDDGAVVEFLLENEKSHKMRTGPEA